MKMYFTFGTDPRYPYQRGEYVVVEGRNEHECKTLFRMIHPDRPAGYLNCADYYPQNVWEGLTSYKEYVKKAPAEYIRLETTVPKTYDEERKERLVEDARDHIAVFIGRYENPSSRRDAIKLDVLNSMDESDLYWLADRYDGKYDCSISAEAQWDNLIEDFLDAAVGA